ncbi:MAG: hypothetical protein ABIP38_08430 [Steroidobacteraceae bacterium]
MSGTRAYTGIDATRARFGEAYRVHWMRQQQGRNFFLTSAALTHHRGEEAGHAIGIEAGRGQIADADAIGLMLFHAREIDLLLHGRALRNGNDARHGFGIAGDGAHENRPEHGRQRGEAAATLRLYRTRNVPLHHVADFVRHHARQFRLGIGEQHQSRMHGNEATWQCKCVDAAVAHSEEGQALFALLGLDTNPAPQSLQVVGGFRIFQYQVLVAQVAHDHATDLVLICAADDRIGRAAQIRQ